MPMFSHVDSPSFSPTMCVACWANSCPRGFVDLQIHAPVRGFHQGAPVSCDASDTVATHGRLYLCAQCVEQAGRLFGCLDARQAAELRTLADEAVDRAAELTDALAVERENRLVPVGVAVAAVRDEVGVFRDEMLEALRRRGGRPPKDNGA
jgi:hypothetical protein